MLTNMAAALIISNQVKLQLNAVREENICLEGKMIVLDSKRLRKGWIVRDWETEYCKHNYYCPSCGYVIASLSQNTGPWQSGNLYLL